MVQILNLPRSPTAAVNGSPSPLLLDPRTRHRHIHHNGVSLLRSLKCDAGFTWFFSDNRKEEQARKALESALGGKKTEFENWDKEIKNRGEVGGGGDGRGGGWFRWFGGSSGDHFWHEAQQTSLAVLGIALMYLIIARGEVMFATIFNPMLFALRGIRNGLTIITSWVLQKVAPTSHANVDNFPRGQGFNYLSAKERVVRKWGSD